MIQTDIGYRVLIEQLEVFYLVKKFPDFQERGGSLQYGNITKALHICKI
jgi:hypothetical protein